MFLRGPAVTSQDSVQGEQSAWCDNTHADHRGDPGPGRVQNSFAPLSSIIRHPAPYKQHSDECLLLKRDIIIFLES